MMTEPAFDQLLEFFKALADASRLRIVGILASRPCTVQELAEALGVREPTVSHHLKRLKALGLVKMSKVGNNHVYALDTDALESLSKGVFEPEHLITVTTGVDTDKWRRKVLSNFVKADGNLQIPASRKKREVILQWLSEQFEFERRYPEPELNAIIQRHHEDCATLRRELVGAKLMLRERGIYWRPGPAE